MANLNRKIRAHRAKFRKRVLKEGKPAYTKDEYIKRIRVHHKTLEKYLKQFYIFADIYTKYNLWNYIRLCYCIGRKRLNNIIFNKDSPTINEVLIMFKKLYLKREFIHYLLNKTHLSYSTDKSCIHCIHDKKRYDNVGSYTKFAEFIYLILSEYIILHNYMFASGLKLRSIKSVDKFLKDIR